MKKNLQILGAGASLTDKSNIFEGLYEYNLVFYECGVKSLVNQDLSIRQWDEKYDLLDVLFTTLNVIFDGYNVYEISNKIEHQYVELNWIGNYVNANPTLLKLFFSVKEKIKAFKVRKNSIVEKSKTNYEIKKMLDDRQKTLAFMSAEDMIVNGLNSGKINIINNNYDPKKAEKFLIKTYTDTVVPAKYKRTDTQSAGSKLFGKSAPQNVDPDLKKLLSDTKIEEMLLKSEWLWHQYEDKGNEKQTPTEGTYAVVCLVKVVEKLLDRKISGNSKQDSAPNKKVIITKTGKVIELSDEGAQAPVANKPIGPNIIESISNIVVALKDKSEENVEYVKAYVNDWLDAIVNIKFDKDNMMSLFESEELRAKTFQVIKKLRADLL